MGCSGEECIALSATAGLRDANLLPVLQHFAQLDVRLRIDHDSAWRHGHDDIRAAATGFVVALTVLPAFRGPSITIRIVKECREIRISPEVDISTLAAVAAIRTALRNKFFPPERRRAGTAGPGHDANDDAIDKIIVDAHDASPAVAVCAERTWPQRRR